MEATTSSTIGKIGEAAGVLWQHLATAGPVNMTALAKEIDLPRDSLMQAIGWLAREDKIDIIEDSRKKRIVLKENGALSDWKA